MQQEKKSNIQGNLHKAIDCFSEKKKKKRTLPIRRKQHILKDERGKCAI